MRFDILAFDPHPPIMVPNHKKIVSALQNSTLDPLDLLVRESIQNSLDAAQDADNREKDVRVEFMSGEFDADSFAETLDGESEDCLKRCLSRYNKVPNKFFAVRDANCSGLTGNAFDRESNLYKLVYGFLDGKGSSLAEGAEGGSVGVGKTVFLRFGLGFVIYYSKTTDGHNRLAMFYCKNRDDISIFPREMLPHQLAWWGRHSARSGEENAVYPIEDSQKIAQFLAMFGMSPYGDNQTGTTIIIPFFDKSQPAHDEVSGFKPWLNSVDAYLRFSLLKWYVPRYRGDLKIQADEKGARFRSYKWGRYLRCMFPDRARIPDALSVEERKIFGLIRDLYDVAVGELPATQTMHRVTVTSNNIPSNIPPLYFRSNNIGWMGICKINYAEGEYANTLPILKALSPDQTIDGRKGFVLYCRKPGMILSYDDTWEKVLSGASCVENEFFVAVFAVKSDNMVLTDDSTGNRRTLCYLDQLFRETEKSDHYGWPIAGLSQGFKLINRVVGNLRSEVTRLYGGKTPLQESAPDSDMSRGFGSIFMAGRTGFGATPTYVEGNGGLEPVSESKATGTKKEKSSILIGDYDLSLVDDGIQVSVPLSFRINTNDRLIRLGTVVLADGKPFAASDWRTTDGTFPVKIVGFEFKNGTAEMDLDADNAEIEFKFGNEISEASGMLTYIAMDPDISTLVRRAD